MAYRAQVYDSPHLGRMSDLIRLKGQTQAEAEYARGQRNAALVSGIGQAVGGVLSDVVKRRETEPARRLAESKMAAEQQALDDARQMAEASRLVPPREDGRPDLAGIAREWNYIDPLKAYPLFQEASKEEQAQLAQLAEQSAQAVKMIGAVLQLPPPQRQAAYSQLREQAITEGLAKPEEVPESYSEGWLRGQLLQLMPAAEFAKLLQEQKVPTRAVTTKNPDGSETTAIVEDTPGQTFTGAPPPKPEPQNIEAALLQAVRSGDQAEVAKLLAAEKQLAEANRAPVQPSTPVQRFSPATMQTADGRTIPANYDALSGKYFDVDTGEELRGLKPPPTADMRNKAEGRTFVKRSIDAIKALSEKVITKRGVAQRATAAGRSVEAALGNDPEYRTYQDARKALAGNLAVAQQGSRPSDADILSIWLPLVPDVFRDTDESAAMKWDLINTMSLPDGGSTPPPGPVLVTLPNGQQKQFPTQEAANAFKKAAGIK